MRRRRILVSDDDRNTLEAVRVRLQAEGFDVSIATDGYQAVAMARSAAPDLVVLDIGMPAGDGFSVHERLRQIPELDRVPIIYMTGQDPDVVDRRAMQDGARAVLHKPFRGADLIEECRAALGFWKRQSAG
jgi:DNA-binding response OmpR family regulator